MHLGFVTVLHDPGGYVGGYLVTNQWGRPLEFRLSTAVQPNRVQQILYAGTLEPYICADLIGKTLVDKTGVPVNLVVTDTAAALDLRLRLEVPVAWVGPPEESPGGPGIRGPVQCHPGFPEDGPAVAAMLDRLTGLVDLAEPFTRIREAIAEARKMGMSRAA
jgi:hypothetical protein